MEPGQRYVSPSPLDADGDAPPLRMLFDPRGRISRRRWWLWGMLVPAALALLLNALLGIAQVHARTAESLVNLLLAWPFAAVAAKRLHDRGLNGAWVLATLVPLLGQLWLLVVAGCLPGQPGDNRYGPPPLR